MAASHHIVQEGILCFYLQVKPGCRVRPWVISGVGVMDFRDQIMWAIVSLGKS